MNLLRGDWRSRNWEVLWPVRLNLNKIKVRVGKRCFAGRILIKGMITIFVHELIRVFR